MTRQFIKVEGIELASARLSALLPKTQRKILPKVVRAASRPFLLAARAEAPARNKFLRRSLIVLIRRYLTSVWAIIGQEKGKAFRKTKRLRTGGISGRGDAVPIHLVEEPTRPHVIRKKSGRPIAFDSGGRRIRRSVRHPGTRGKHFVRSAAASAEKPSLAAFEAKLTEELLKEA